MTVHELKCWPEYFEALRDGRKTFEFRVDDRDFVPGDILWLREWHPDTRYSGRDLRRRVTYVMDATPVGAAGYVVMSLEDDDLAKRT
jgi:hypothetical protein